MSDKQRDPALQEAIDLVGGVGALAEQLELTQPAISMWTRVPAKHVLKVERLTKGRVDRYRLRSDIFGSRPKHSSAAE